MTVAILLFGVIINILVAVVAAVISRSDNITIIDFLLSQHYLIVYANVVVVSVVVGVAVKTEIIVAIRAIFHNTIKISIFILSFRTRKLTSTDMTFISYRYWN